MRAPYVVYGINGHSTLPIFMGETRAESEQQAINFVRWRRFPFQRIQDTGYEFHAFIKESQGELAARRQARNVPSSLRIPPRPIPSSLV